ncbi:MAG: hypothetical protein GF390_04060 [Candidatus Pacebacteria bacterium]|nr:hypothetical protein [Candidatus Paceibacterota bacterium]
MNHHQSSHSSQTSPTASSSFNLTALINPLTIIRILFHTLLLTTPLIFTTVNEELFEFPKMLWVYAFTVLISTAWASRMLFNRRLIFKKSSLDWPIWIFLASQILATLFSIHLRTSLLGYYTRFHGGLLSTISYVLLYHAAVSNLTKKDLLPLLRTIVLSGLLVSLYAIPEHFGHSPSCLMISNQFNVQCWVQDVQTRVYATLGQPNWLAAYLITLMPISLSLWLKQTQAKDWLNLQANFYLASSILMFVALIFTKSRSGVGALAMGLLILGLGYFWQQYQGYQQLESAGKKRQWQKNCGQKLAIVGISFGLIITIFGTPFTPSITKLWQQLTSPKPAKKAAQQVDKQPTAAKSPPGSTNNASQAAPLVKQGGTESFDIRKIVWQGAIKVWQRYPLFGSGVETFAYSYYQDRPVAHNLVSEWDFLYNKAHNEWLNLLATTGIVGLSSYLLILGWFSVLTLKTYWQQLQSSSPEKSLISLGLLASFIALAISNFFGFSTVAVTVVMFITMALLSKLIGNQKQTINQSTQSTPTTHQLSWPESLGLFLLILASLYCLKVVFSWWQADNLYATGKQLSNAGYLNAGSEYLQQAVIKSPHEPVFYDELAENYAQLAIQLQLQQNSTASAQLAQAALQASDHTLQLNSRHLDFYKTRARVLITLAQLEPQLLEEAQATLTHALTLAPTDAKLMYNLGLVELSLDHSQAGIAALTKAVEMKPNYERARLKLAEQLVNQGQLQAAAAHYQYILDYLNPQQTKIKQRLQSIQASLSAQPQAN